MEGRGEEGRGGRREGRGEARKEEEEGRLGVEGREGWG